MLLAFHTVGAGPLLRTVSFIMRAQEAKPKSRRDDMIKAQKRGTSAALGWYAVALSGLRDGEPAHAA